MDELIRRENWARTRPSVLSGTLKVIVNADRTLSFKPAVGDTGRMFSDFEEADDYVRNRMGLTNFHDPGDTFSRYTSITTRELHRAAQDRYGQNARVIQEVYDFSDPDQFAAFRERSVAGDVYRGYLNRDGNKVTHYRVFRDVGKELDTGEVAKFFEDSIGLVIQEANADKLAKRFKAHAASKTYEMFTEDLLKVGVVDFGTLKIHGESVLDLQESIAEISRRVQTEGDYKKRLMGQYKDEIAGLSPDDVVKRLIELESDAAVRTSVDGMNLGSKGFFKKMEQAQRGLVAELRAELNKAEAAGDTYESRRLAREISVLQDDISELQKVIKHGHGVFNFRGEGFVKTRLATGGAFSGGDSAGLTQALRDMEDKAWQIKGNIHLDPRLDKMGVDVLTDYGNVKFEAGTLHSAVADAFGKRRSFATLTMFKQRDRVLIDMQSLASYPDFFTRQLLGEAHGGLISDIDEVVAAIDEMDPEKRQFPKGFLDRLESEARSLDPDNQKRARNILHAIEQKMRLADDPYIRNEIFRMLQEGSYKERYGFKMPKLQIPDAVSREVTSAAAFKGTGMRKMVRGEIQTIGSQLIMHEDDVVRAKALHGGFDLDDAFNVIFRYDAGERQMKALLLRSPNARGEHSIFNLSRVDEVILNALETDQEKTALRAADEMTQKIAAREGNIEVLRRQVEAGTAGAGANKQLGKMIAELEQWKKQAAVLETKAHQVLRSRFGSADVFRNLPPQRRSSHITDVSIPDPNRPGQFLEGYRFDGEDITYLRQEVGQKVQGVGKFTDLSIDQQRLLLSQNYERFADELAGLSDAAVLGIYSNARMFVDHWMGVNAERFSELPDLAKNLMERFHPMEQEAVIDVLKQGGVAQTEEIMETARRMVALVYEGAARAKAAGKDWSIDPTAARLKAKNRVAVERGVEAAEAQTGKRFSPKQLEMDPTDIRATYSYLTESQEAVEAHIDSLRSAGSYADYVLEDAEIRTSSTFSRKAHEVIRAYRDVASEAYGLTDKYEKSRIYRAAQDAVIETISRTFDESGEAGEATYRTILRTMQMIEDSEFGADPQILGALWRLGADNGGLTMSALNWQKNRWSRNLLAQGLIDPTEVSNEIVNTISMSHVEDALGALTPKTLAETMGEVLEGSNITLKMLEDIQKGVGLAAGENLPEAVREIMTASKNAVFAVDDTLMGPLDPSAVITNLPDTLSDSGSATLGSLLRRYKEAGDVGQRDLISQHVQHAAQRYTDAMFSWASEQSMPSTVRDRVIRAMDRVPAAPGSPGASQAAAARQAAETAETVLDDGGKYTRTNMLEAFKNLNKSTKGWIGGASAAMVGMSLIHSIRNRDHTINDIQGPAFLPGGNPYEGDREIPQMAQPQGFSPPSQGTTYEVRTRGGKHDDSFLAELSRLTQAPVEGSTYGTLESPFQSNAQRDRILRSY